MNRACLNKRILLLAIIGSLLLLLPVLADSGVVGTDEVNQCEVNTYTIFAVSYTHLRAHET